MWEPGIVGHGVYFRHYEAREFVPGVCILRGGDRSGRIAAQAPSVPVVRYVVNNRATRDIELGCEAARHPSWRGSPVDEKPFLRI
jgi:hypothetical protein